MKDAKPVNVLGAGIAGLSVAIALARAGAQVQVLEQAQAIAEVGAGVQISPNGFRVLEALGIGADLQARSVRAQAVSLRDYRAGREVLRLDLARLAAHDQYRFVHRADLIRLLEHHARAAGVEIKLGRKVTSLSPGAPGRASLEDGSEISAELFLGADGLHSVARAALNGAAAPFFTGQVAWRALVPNRMDHPDEAQVHMGPGRHLVSYPLRGGAMVNLVAVEERRAWADEGWHHRDDPQTLRRAFAAFGGAAKAMIDAVDDPAIWGLFRHEVAQRWHGEGVALLGDAAHPTLPFLAQGANMALEDAWALARCLETDADPQAALARYQRLRRDRVCRVIAAANGNAWKYHLRQPLIRGAAHLGLRIAGRVAPARMVGQFDWLYGYDITRAL